MKRQLVWYIVLVIQWCWAPLANAQDNSVTLDDLAFVIEQSFNTDASRKLIVEVLKYLDEKISAWVEDNSSSLPSCIPEREEELVAVLEQVDSYLEKPIDLLELLSNSDLTRIKQYADRQNTLSQEDYQSVLTDVEWSDFVCNVFGYLSDTAEGRGDVAVGRDEVIKKLIESFRTASLQRETSFSVSLDCINNKTDKPYFISGISGLNLQGKSGQKVKPHFCDGLLSVLLRTLRGLDTLGMRAFFSAGWPVPLYQISMNSNTLTFVSAMVVGSAMYISSALRVLKKLSATALSQQLPFRLILCTTSG